MLKYISFVRALILIFLFNNPTFVFPNTEELDIENNPLSTPEQVSSFYKNDNFLIDGIINPLSGNLSLCKTDLISKGAQFYKDNIYY